MVGLVGVLDTPKKSHYTKSTAKRGSAPFLLEIRDVSRIEGVLCLASGCRN